MADPQNRSHEESSDQQASKLKQILNYNTATGGNSIKTVSINSQGCTIEFNRSEKEPVFEQPS
jgi:hypothetical protein